MTATAACPATTVFRDDFVYGTEVYNKFFEEAADTVATLNAAEWESLYMYTGSDFKELRRQVMEGVECGVDVTALDSVTGRCAERTRVVWRGLMPRDEFAVGDTWCDPFFLSCTASLGVAAKFGSRREGGVLLRIETTAGVCLGEGTSVFGFEEREVLLPREHKFVVTNVFEEAQVMFGGRTETFKVVCLRDA